MPKFNAKIMAFAAATVVIGGISFAQERPSAGSVSPASIPSDAEGAMAPPSQWNCDLYVQEYRDWLDAGNRFADWQYAGKSYRDVDTGEKYTAAQWRLWLSKADCPGVVFAKDELVVPVMQQLIYGVAAAGAPVVASQVGTASPG
ncbi:hypothetical protein GRI42_06645 [Erythrobacter gaetbuli]|uniref:Uncharacterized protein n=1 Tax=Qipengyuania gaetbuli TaxID=266952 RepID=A0A844Y077_9SPHN|nr:hypothetical protein [Qipengyuania gaetbuli]MXO50979.1 hypothetical protein [Qipengyuania gaetbuli]